MTRRNYVVYLRHMLDFAREAHSLSADHSRDDLDTDRLLNLALTRLVELAGEAANRVPLDQRAKYPGIDWSQIIAMRNRLIYGYDLLDLDVIWDTVTNDLPRLVEELESILAMED